MNDHVFVLCRQTGKVGRFLISLTLKTSVAMLGIAVKVKKKKYIYLVRSQFTGSKVASLFMASSP
jgi:hypothetical protein